MIIVAENNINAKFLTSNNIHVKLKPEYLKGCAKACNQEQFDFIGH